MNLKRAVMTGLLLAILFIAYQSIWHGMFLDSYYKETVSIWRPEAAMMSTLYLLFLGEAIFAFFFAIVFAAGFENKKPALGQGFRFGLLMSCMLAPFSGLAWYVILPIPAALAFLWFLGDFIAMILLGLAAGLIYKPRK